MVLIIGIIAQLVLPTFMSDVPIAKVRAEAQKLAALLDYLRAESRLQSERYGVEIETPERAPHRYRILLPKDKVLAREGEKLEDNVPPDGRPDFFTMAWQELPEGVYFRAIHIGALERDKGTTLREVSFDPRGRTSQKILEVGFRDQDEVVYSVVVAPLSGAVSVEKGSVPFRTATDGDFF